MQVYWTGSSNTSVHLSADCLYLKGPQRLGKPLRQVELADVKRPRLCINCFPNAPRIKVAHVRCRKCNKRQTLPCQHNGGVRVLVERDLQSPFYVNLQGQPGHYQPKWVWPEHAHWYTLAQPLLAS